MKDSQLLYIKTIAEEQSISKAAKKLGISQPALSAYITKLEKQIGAQLLDRSISPLQLTEAGEQYLEYAETVLLASETFYNTISDLNELKTGRIVIGSTSCFSCYLSTPIARYLAKYPGVHISICEGRIPDIQTMCLNGKVDLFISDTNIDTELFSIEKLFDECFLVMLPAQHPMNGSLRSYQIPSKEIVAGCASSEKYQDIDLSVFAGEQFILLQEDQHVRKMAEDVCHRYHFKPREIMQVPQMMTAFSLVNAGIGASFITESAVRYSNILQHPIYYRINKQEISRSIAVSYKKNKYLSKACRVMINALKEEFHDE